MKLPTLTIVCALLLMSTDVPCASAMKRRHNGPDAGESETVLHGRTTTNAVEEGEETGLVRSTLQGEDEKGMGTTFRQAGLRSRRIVDFALHLKRPVVIWSEVKEDAVQLHSCRLNKRTRRATFTLSGDGLDIDDYARGVVFVVDEKDCAECLGRQLPDMRGIDASDSQLFLSIVHNRTETASTGSQASEKSVHIVSKVVPGRIVCPKVDIAIHDESDPEMAEAMVAPVEYEDEPHSSWTAHILISRQLGPDGNDTLLPNVAERISIPEQEVSLGGGSSLEVSANVDVKLTSFSINRSLQMQLVWELETTVDVDGDLKVSESLSGSRSTGQLLRVDIPSISFSIDIPIVGSMGAGAFFEAHWVSEVSATRSLAAEFSGSYTRKDKVHTQVFPVAMGVEHVGSSTNGAGVFGAGDGSTGVVASGFFGVQPVVEMGVSYRNALFVVTKSVGAYVSSEFGVSLSATDSSPPYAAYTGSDAIGTCGTCHSIRGSINFKGQNFKRRVMINGDIADEKTLVANIFDTKIGTVCANVQPC